MEELERRLLAATSDIHAFYARARLVHPKISEKLLLRHVLIVGSSGSGKTNHAFNLVKEAYELEGARS